VFLHCYLLSKNDELFYWLHCFNVQYIKMHCFSKTDVDGVIEVLLLLYVALIAAIASCWGLQCMALDGVKRDHNEGRNWVTNLAEILLGQQTDWTVCMKWMDSAVDWRVHGMTRPTLKYALTYSTFCRARKFRAFIIRVRIVKLLI